ncbi:MAG TPA: ferredoxin family protein [bacterium]|nr:ferredoxin family protein [bacterium]
MPKIIIDSEECKGCYLCIEVCPKKSIEIGNKLNSKGYYPAVPVKDGTCSGCESCMLVCPDMAIEVYDEKK